MILVSGAYGFIGSNLSYDLVYNGHEVVMVDNLWNSQWNIGSKLQNLALRLNKPVPKIEILNLGEKEAVDRLFRTYNIDTVVHLADTKIRYSDGTYTVNVVGTGNLLTHHEELQTFVLGSTIEMFRTGPVHVNEYITSKMVSEGLVREYGREHELDYSILRMSNVGGYVYNSSMPYQPRKTTNLMQSCFRVSVGLDKEVVVNGNNFRTRDGTPVRDYVHVGDVVSAINVAMNSSGRNKNRTYAIASGAGHTVMEVIEEYSKVSGSNIPNRVVNSDRTHGQRFIELSADNTLDGWTATNSLSDICKSHWDSQIELKHEKTWS